MAVNIPPPKEMKMAGDLAIILFVAVCRNCELLSNNDSPFLLLQCAVTFAVQSYKQIRSDSIVFFICSSDVRENLRKRHQSVSRHIKEKVEGEEVERIKEEEEELLHSKEEEQEEIIQVPSTGVHLKSKDEGQSEERRGAELPSWNSSSDGECNNRGLQTDGHDDDDEQSEELHKVNMSLRSGKNYLKDYEQQNEADTESNTDIGGATDQPRPVVQPLPERQQLSVKQEPSPPHSTRSRAPRRRSL
ncbi:uncharacterized protein LOC133493939 [Syngnathoides biaculeatus]|uniref:uncharacterized protein LOC133493939 n=1 Tax=Syngnathoides biaculeatus TaxID=300417 RepID=UPI002ADDA9F0|nr:uncharacterized protein LOC133493939 [Syngnathoides biaculeatus]